MDIALQQLNRLGTFNYEDMKLIKETTKTVFDGELYDLVEFEDGSKRLSIHKNRAGFKININVSGCKKEHEQGVNAVKDFFVKGCM